MSELVLPDEVLAALDELDYEPIPQLAPARSSVTLAPFKLANPIGENVWTARFDGDEVAGCRVTHCAVRYPDMSPVYLPFGRDFYPGRGDSLLIKLHTGRRR